MDRFLQMRVFVTVAELSGFAAAARSLSMSAPAVTRAVASLEDSLGVKLLKRTTRHVRTTDAGAQYLEDAKRILAELKAAEEVATGVNAIPRGRVSVTAPVLFGRLFIMPGVVDYLHKYSEVSVDTIFLDRVVNLLEEGIDIGVRIGELPDSSMRARRVGSVRIVLVASPDYLSHADALSSPDDLANHQLISSRAGNFSHTWRFNSDGLSRSIKVNPRLSVTTNDSAISAALHGLGVARVLSYQVAEELKKKQLEILLPEWEVPALPIHIVHRDEINPPAKVRALIDILVQQISDKTALTTQTLV